MYPAKVFLLLTVLGRALSKKKKRGGAGRGAFIDFAGLLATSWTKIHIPLNIFPGGLASTEMFIAERCFSTYPQSVRANSVLITQNCVLI